MKVVFSFFGVFILFSFVVGAEASALVFDKEEIKNRVSERWETIIGHKFGETYSFETPTYKAVFTQDLYINQFSYGVDWSLTKIADIKYDSATNVATVVVVVETRPKNSKGLDSKAKIASVEIREKWLHIKGQWWHSSSD